MSIATPSFAVVGAVNHGKSSVVSTLAENDQVVISPMPGETVNCQRFSLRDLFVFYDTPGFQNAFDALAELQPAARASEPLQVFREFIARHRGEPEFASECRLFTPVTDGAGIIYVVDGSRPVLDINVAEMEILRLTGQPRLAIINRTSTDDHIQDWKRRLGQHFNAIREFNAHRATFSDRIELLETLAQIEQSWKSKLSEAVSALRGRWNDRIDDCAGIIVELLVNCLQYRKSSGARVDVTKRREEIEAGLKSLYMQDISAVEMRAHQEIIELFRHNLVTTGVAAESLFSNDLFSDETWELFGLEAKQLVVAATVGGALAGAGADLLLAFHSFGLFTLAGGAVGAGGAFILGKQRPEITVQIPGTSRYPDWIQSLVPRNLQFSGSAIVVGPYKAINFPWILLDRAFGTFWYLINRSHGRRDKITLEAAQLKKEMESHGITSALWDDDARRTCEKAFLAIRKGKMTREQRAELQNLVRLRLVAISGEEIA